MQIMTGSQRHTTLHACMQTQCKQLPQVAIPHLLQLYTQLRMVTEDRVTAAAIVSPALACMTCHVKNSVTREHSMPGSRQNAAYAAM